jgi:outer membrane biosynthesis protein TonB
MSAQSPRRAPLEPFLPAVVGIGLAHVLLGMCVWIVYPLLPARPQSMSGAAALTWFSPADFLIPEKQPETVPMPKEMPVAAVPPSAQGGAPIGIDLSPPGGLAAAAVETAPPAMPAPPAMTLAPPIMPVSPPMTGPVAPLPVDTLANLEKSMKASQGSLLTPENPLMTTQATAAPQSPADPAREAAPAPTALKEGGRAANKYITLSFINATQKAMGAKPMLNLLDIAKLNEATRVGQIADGGGMDAVEEALQQALLREWKPPLIDAVPVTQRRVTVELVVFRDGSVKEAVVQKASGCEALDASVREALSRVTKIDESLPSSFPKERYPLRVNLLIE